MPIYEYQCQECEEIVEAWQSISDEPLTSCPKCSGELKKLISMSAFHLKGGGWYADGYSGKSNQKNGSACEAKACPAADSKNTSKSTPACPKADSGTSCCAS